MKSCRLVCTSLKDDLKVIYSFITTPLRKWMKFYWGFTETPSTSKVEQDLPSITRSQDILKYATIYIVLGILIDEEMIQGIKIIFHHLSSIFFTFRFVLLLSHIDDICIEDSSNLING